MALGLPSCHAGGRSSPFSAPTSVLLTSPSHSFVSRPELSVRGQCVTSAFTSDWRVAGKLVKELISLPWKRNRHPHADRSSVFLFFLNFCFILFFYFWLSWVFVAVRRLSLVAASGGYSSLRCAGLSLRWLPLLWSTGSRCAGLSNCVSRALEHRLSSRGTCAQLLRGTWDPPRPGLEPVFPALAGGLPNTAPLGKSPEWCFMEGHRGCVPPFSLEARGGSSSARFRML